MPKMKTHKGAKKRFSVTGKWQGEALQGLQEPHPHEEDLQAEAPASSRRRRSRRNGEAKNLKRLLQA